jgi:anti-sigma regulatory factor (Ser/Thr protein kinase)
MTTPAAARPGAARRVFDRDSAASRDARIWLRDMFEDQQISASLPDAELMLSELVTNVISHTDSDAVVTVEKRPGTVRVTVSDDDSSTRPVAKRAATVTIGGRGLMIVEALSYRWGIDRDAGGGKKVWFEVASNN